MPSDKRDEEIFETASPEEYRGPSDEIDAHERYFDGGRYVIFDSLQY